MTRHFCVATVLVLATAVAGCGGSDSTPTGPSGGGNTGTIAATVTIGANGTVSPADVSVPVGSRVTFVNNHNQPHEMASDPHPTHGSCPAIDQVGQVPAGQSRTSGNLNTPGACRYHDHINPGSTGLQGVIRVQ